MSVTIQQNSINLSKLEFLMLKYFMENVNVALSRNQIIDKVWGKDSKYRSQQKSNF